MSTVDQVFTQAGLWKWYSSPATNPFDGVNEKGMDFANAFGTPVGSPIAGSVVRTAQFANSIGSMIEIQAVDGSVWLFQHLTGKLATGAKVSVGTIIGLENGLPVDQYSTGPHIEVRYTAPGTWNAATPQYGEPWINPASVYAKIGGAAASGTPPPVSVPTPTPITQTIAKSLAPTADVTALLILLDGVMTLLNPFDVGTVNVVGGTTISDPISWLAAFGTNLWDDLGSVGIRLLFLLSGSYILLKTMNEFIDYGALVERIGLG
jgi:murein DD-endopeptidase MepM/ murein hydrolase activator NlpD